MATIKDLPCELLYHIIFLLVQSIDGAEELARLITVSRDFLSYAEKKSILEVVNFNVKMEPVNFYRFQNVQGLLVKCSEAGNAAAQHVLGKVILLSSTHLFLNDWQHVRSSVSSLDRPMLNRWIPDTNDPAQNNKVRSFMTYFSPIQVNNSEFSSTRLVHYQLVKLFLLNGSHNDFVEMGVFLKYCVKHLMRLPRRNNPLIDSIILLVIQARSVRAMEILAKSEESFNDCFRVVREVLEVKAVNLDRNIQDFFCDPSGDSCEFALANEYLLNIYLWKCVIFGVDRQEAVNDLNFVEALREDMSKQLDDAYTKFGIARAETLSQFVCKFG